MLNARAARSMSPCLDFVLNHTADAHKWTVRAKAGEQKYTDRYICCDTPDGTWIRVAGKLVRDDR